MPLMSSDVLLFAYFVMGGDRWGAEGTLESTFAFI